MFQTEWYKRSDWPCGCATLNRLFCFSSLLFGGTIDMFWANGGYCDLNNSLCAVAKHEKSVVHIQSKIALTTFGHNRINLALNEKWLLNISIHNQKVKKNRSPEKSYRCCMLPQKTGASFLWEQRECNFFRGNFVELLHLIAALLIQPLTSQHLQCFPVTAA